MVNYILCRRVAFLESGDGRLAITTGKSIHGPDDDGAAVSDHERAGGTVAASAGAITAISR